jgi:hypothetical protein
MGVDGMMVRFERAPHGFPPGLALQDFNCRKNFWALNCQLVCNDEMLILDLDCHWSGKTHDGHVWSWSAIRTYLEAVTGPFLIAGDSVYPISPVLMKPYSNREAADDPQKCLFNERLSSIRTVKTENVFGRVKNTFRILRMLRAHLDNAKMIITAVCILHNIMIKMRDVEPEGDAEVLDYLRVVIKQMGATRGRPSGRVLNFDPKIYFMEVESRQRNEPLIRRNSACFAKQKLRHPRYIL